MSYGDLWLPLPIEAPVFNSQGQLCYITLDQNYAPMSEGWNEDNGPVSLGANNIHDLVMFNMLSQSWMKTVAPNYAESEMVFSGDDTYAVNRVPDNTDEIFALI
jgi:hypothetical protein